MGPFDFFWHLVNLLAVPLLFAAVATSLSMLVWRRSSGGVPWRRIWAWTSGASVAVALCGLAITGRDGRMATYAVQVLAVAVVIGVMLWRRRA